MVPPDQSLCGPLAAIPGEFCFSANPLLVIN